MLDPAFYLTVAVPLAGLSPPLVSVRGFPLTPHFGFFLPLFWTAFCGVHCSPDKNWSIQTPEDEALCSLTYLEFRVQPLPFTLFPSFSFVSRFPATAKTCRSPWVFFFYSDCEDLFSTPFSGKRGGGPPPAVLAVAKLRENSRRPKTSTSCGEGVLYPFFPSRPAAHTFVRRSNVYGQIGQSICALSFTLAFFPPALGHSGGLCFFTSAQLLPFCAGRRPFFFSG